MSNPSGTERPGIDEDDVFSIVGGVRISDRDLPQIAEAVRRASEGEQRGSRGEFGTALAEASQFLSGSSCTFTLLGGDFHCVDFDMPEIAAPTTPHQ